jgi:DNA-damage-inducible protein D
MKKEIIKSFTHNFDDHSHTTENGIEFWFARDLQHLLGYSEWQNFNLVVAKAKTTCEVTGNSISDHFVDVNKTIAMPKGASKEIQDIMLILKLM